MSEITEEGKGLVAQTKAADQKHCFSCGVLLHLSASQCPKCGAQQPSVASVVIAGPTVQTAQAVGLSNNQVFCRGCGAVIHESAPTCPKCGAQQRANAGLSFTSGRNRTTAAILGILLGGLGVHKFYLGSNLLGFFYLIFCWTFIPGIIGLIEGIYYLTLSDDEFNKKYS